MRQARYLGVAALALGVFLLAGWSRAGAPPAGAAPPAAGQRAVTPSPAGVIASAASFVPIDPKTTCTVTAATVASWFQSGTVTLNGVVNPANSVTFPDTPNCSFYQWSEQMFLWLTSPAPPSYGGGAHIFDSPAFYDVSPPDASGARTFIPHRQGIIRPFAVRTAQPGPHGLPVIFDKSGRLLEVARPTKAPSAKPLVRDKSNHMVEIDRVAPGKTGPPAFLDKTGKPIELAPASAGAANRSRAPITVRKFTVGKTPVFVDAAGNVIEVEQGQALDGAVLESQTPSLVYYAIAANDVFVYFRTGEADHQIPATTRFPTTAAELAKITAFASAHGKTFPDPNALAIEIKTSWVEAAGLSNPSSYITMNATIPTYTKSSTQWIPTGQKTALLALVGFHINGSTKGHPEMIWATFEHLGNAPNGTYSYVNKSGVTVTVPSTSIPGPWLFSKTGSSGPFNVAHMDVDTNPPNITPDDPPLGFTPSDTIRWKAWGGASNASPNPLDPTTAASNTEIISINNAVRGRLASGDVRGNYVFEGATWTILGAVPSGSFAHGGNEVGTSQLANTTMETYQQGSDTTSGRGSSNCFSCHTPIPPCSDMTCVSHVYPVLKPLF